MINFFNYIKFCCKSTSNHGVHSPFVYDLITFCFFNKKWKKKRNFFYIKKHLQSNSIFFIEGLKKYLLNYNKNNLSDQFVLKLQSKDNLIELINKLNIKYSQFVLFIDNSHCLKPIIKTIENIKMYIVIDFYFWAIIVKKQGNQSQNYKIRVF